MQKKLKNKNGQVMLLTTLIMSGTILAASTLSGILIVRQIRQASDAGQSAQALYAADAGIEYELYKLYRKNTYSACSESPPSLSNGVDIDTEVTRETNDEGGQDLVITSTGSANNRARAFSLNLGEVSITLCGEEESEE